MNAAIQTAWCDTLIRGLAEAGVVGFVVSPGSRSTPLAIAIARSGHRTQVIIDERSAGFVALGWVRAAGAPVALVCTSGTAVAHYFPAIIEAAHAGLPLIVVSADRPVAAQGAEAAQTIDQQQLFGRFATFVDLGPADPSRSAAHALLRKVASVVVRAHERPAHINVPLEKPLEPAPPSTSCDALVTAPVVRAERPRLLAAPLQVQRIASLLAAAKRPLVVAGPPSSGATVPSALAVMARLCAAPLWAESTTNLRHEGLQWPDLIAASGNTPGQPDLIIRCGREPVGRDVLRLLSEWRGTTTIHLAETWIDPDNQATEMVLGDVTYSVNQLMPPSPRQASSAWLASWQAADQALGARVRVALARHPASETAAIAHALRVVDERTQIVIGNSLPIRQLDWVPPVSARILSQRGANGIDGMLAGAFGSTHTGRPTLAIVGDVTFAHDIGSLQVAQHAKTPLCVVILANGGGRIFEQLPAFAVVDRPTFNEFFVTSPAFDIRQICAGFNVRAERVSPGPELSSIVAQALCTPGLTVIDVPCSAHGAAEFLRTVKEAP